jgi:hypothetical protein
MTPKEKAEKLILKFKKYAYYPKTDDDEIFINQLSKNSKQCALIAVDEIILTNPHTNPFNTDVYSTMDYWKEVKKEIKKL